MSMQFYAYPSGWAKRCTPKAFTNGFQKHHRRCIPQTWFKSAMLTKCLQHQFTWRPAQYRREVASSLVLTAGTDSWDAAIDRGDRVFSFHCALRAAAAVKSDGSKSMNCVCKQSRERLRTTTYVRATHTSYSYYILLRTFVLLRTTIAYILLLTTTA